MVSELFFYELLLFGRLWLCVMLLRVWSDDHAAPGPTTPTPAKPTRQHSGDPEPFPGLTRKPQCVACEQAAQAPATPPPPAPPPADSLHAWPPAPGGHLTTVLPPSGLRLSRLGGKGQSQFEWSSQRWSLATVVWQPLCGVLSGNCWHAVVWQARLSRSAGVGWRRGGRRAGHPRGGPRVRG